MRWPMPACQAMIRWARASTANPAVSKAVVEQLGLGKNITPQPGSAKDRVRDDPQAGPHPAHTGQVRHDHLGVCREGAFADAENSPHPCGTGRADTAGTVFDHNRRRRVNPDAGRRGQVRLGVRLPMSRRGRAAREQFLSGARGVLQQDQSAHRYRAVGSGVTSPPIAFRVTTSIS